MPWRVSVLTIDNNGYPESCARRHFWDARVRHAASSASATRPKCRGRVSGQ